jgi:hypothetical protein
MAKVDRFGFGSIVIQGKKYGHDVLLFPDKTVRQRKGGIWKFGSHSIKKDEIQKLAEANPDVIIVGTGTSGKARICADAESFVQEAEVELVVLPSREAIERLNRLVEEGKQVAALIHITC